MASKRVAKMAMSRDQLAIRPASSARGRKWSAPPVSATNSMLSAPHQAPLLAASSRYKGRACTHPLLPGIEHTPSPDRSTVKSLGRQQARRDGGSCIAQLLLSFLPKEISVHLKALLYVYHLGEQVVMVHPCALEGRVWDPATSLLC